tara:strand:+ start:103 stop:333 length:231 start_codon:yes stop_codon:yes gene_type:complete
MPKSKKNIENHVEDYMMENKGINLSVKSISKRMNIKKKEVLFFINRSNIIEKVDPLEVGSKKKTLNVYCIKIDNNL